ncbi:prepilin-type N-terminal cleavage/methylation domain-containing protein [Sphingomonas sp. LB-2]|uniref:type II secretion system protein GspJ n=1 Tax=Sphingomonas caeni TaxID=2984949 RepID=UPI0022318D41|nr:type II secretion system protein GspJ [Sphingomonas caeni]MCW3847457.1 prepilin-type N-terminal cleavage/methylation domain-containing protein [Sphingomonas caeni]
MRALCGVRHQPAPPPGLPYHRVAYGRPGGGAGWCRTPAQPANEESGFTLIELMISLGLFALIAVAGLALVQGILGVQGRTEVRLDRLAELQRTMFVVTSDIDQIATGRISGNAKEGLKFVRAAPGIGGARIPVEYRLVGGMLIRQANGAPQRLLPGVASARWRFWNGAWRDRWPITDAPEVADLWPQAIEMELVVTDANGRPAGTLRRVVVLPKQLPPEQPGPL